MGKKRVLLTLFSIFLLLVITAVSVFAQPRIVGVSVGDWFKYDMNVHWSSNDPNATIPDYLENLNLTEYWVISVLDVSDTNVTVEMMSHYQNGSDVTDGGLVDVDTGDGNVTAMIISANLEVNDTIYTAGMFSAWKINETITKTYPDSMRETNHVNITTEYSMPPTYQNMSMNYFWDKQCGMFVEITQEAVIKTGENVTTWSLSVIITDSNGWVIPESPTSTTIMLGLAALTTATIMLKRKMQKT